MPLKYHARQLAVEPLAVLPARSPPQVEMDFGQAAVAGEWPEIDQTAGVSATAQIRVVEATIGAPAASDQAGELSPGDQR